MQESESWNVMNDLVHTLCDLLSRDTYEYEIISLGMRDVEIWDSMDGYVGKYWPELI